MQELLRPILAGRRPPRRRSRGFTLLEIMIASTILLLVMGLTVNSIFGFSRTGNQMHAQATLEEQLRVSLNRLEKELIEGAEVLSSYDPGGGGTVVTSGEHALVLKVPVYTSAGFIAVDNNGLPVTDTVIIQSETDSEAEILSLNRSPQRPSKLLLTLVPHAKSNRIKLSKQVIAKNLMPISGNNYLFPGDFGSTGAAGDNGPTFTYYKMNATTGTAETATVGTEANMVSQIKVLLWGEQNASRRLVTAKKELDIRLRNWKDPNQPAPSP